MTDAGRWRGEGKSHGGIEPPIYYPPKADHLKAHQAGPEHDPNRSRSRSGSVSRRGLTWHDVPADKRYQQTGKLEPHPGETANHVTYRHDGNQVTNYQAWTHNSHTGQMTDAGRWRGEGKSHGGIEPPIYYPPKADHLKAHQAGPEHDPNRSRSRSGSVSK
ncbi:hypothetical protein H0H93_014626 [Arthromyces matolae]|nr:hypothetical protein H0H93_014626 [Arthromyces matolae]